MQTNTKKRTIKITSLLLAFVMLLSAFGGFGSTAFAKEKVWKESEVLLDSGSGQLVSHMNGDSFSITFGGNKFTCVELVVTSDIPMDVLIESDLNADPFGQWSFPDVTEHTHSFLYCNGTFNIKISRGASAGDRIGSYEFKLYNRTPKPSVKKLTSKKKAIGVKWNKKAGVTGYQIQYSTDENFSNAKKVNVKGANKASATVKKLKKGKRYYVRIRTFKTVDGKKYYSSWSKAKTVKTK